MSFLHGEATSQLTAVGLSHDSQKWHSVLKHFNLCSPALKRPNDTLTKSLNPGKYFRV
jgi:hypothetical protein